MHSTNFDAKISELHLIYINLNLKILNILARLSDVAKQRSRAVTKVAKQRIENLKSQITQTFLKRQIEFIKYSNLIKAGDL